MYGWMNGWDGMGWDGIRQDGIGWNGTGLDRMGLDGMEWDGMGWDGMGRMDGWMDLFMPANKQHFGDVNNVLYDQLQLD